MSCCYSNLVDDGRGLLRERVGGVASANSLRPFNLQTFAMNAQTTARTTSRFSFLRHCSYGGQCPRGEVIKQARQLDLIFGTRFSLMR